MYWARRIAPTILVLSLFAPGATVQASEELVCGDGVVAKGEPCDVASAEQRCPKGYGCIKRKDGRCKCAPSCDHTEPSDAAFDAADKHAEAEVRGAWGSEENWDRYWRIIETELGCSVHTGGEDGMRRFRKRMKSQ